MGLKLKSLLRAALQIAGTAVVLKPSLLPVVQNLETVVQLGGALASSIGVILGQLNAKKTKEVLTEPRKLL